MKITGVFLASGATPVAHLPKVLSDGFGISVGEAKRLLRRGEVTLAGEVTERWDVPVKELRGAELAIGRERVTLDA